MLSSIVFLRTRLFVLVLIVTTMMKNLHAFTTGRTCTSTHGQQQLKVETKLSAWSLPSPADFTSFASMKKSTWYDEYNPTARRTVYNE